MPQILKENLIIDALNLNGIEIYSVRFKSLFHILIREFKQVVRKN